MREETKAPSRVTTARPPQLPAIVVTPHSQPGIRSKARLFENDNKAKQEKLDTENPNKLLTIEFYIFD